MLYGECKPNEVRRAVFGISMWEIVLILVVALIFLGPRQLTETARVIGKLYREIQKMAYDVRNSIDFDSELSSPPQNTYTSSKKEPGRPAGQDQDLLPPPGEKSGPDFYAELLEKSKEEEKKTEKEVEESSESSKESGSGPDQAGDKDSNGSRKT